MPHPGTTPTRAWVSANRAFVLAIRKSHINASSNPPVMAKPFTAPITGLPTPSTASETSRSEIARDPADLVGELIGKTHQYPDGAILYLGTMFAPTKDRGAAGMGFTHKVGDIVSVTTPSLGRLTNRMTVSNEAPAWTFGTRSLMHNLAKRGLLK